MLTRCFPTLVFSLWTLVSLCISLLGCNGNSHSSANPPILLEYSPEEGQQDVSHDSPLELVFSEAIQIEDLAGLTLSHDGIAETGRVEVQAETAYYSPDNGWFVGATYQVQLAGVVDSSGDPIAPWSFTTTGDWRQVEDAPESCAAFAVRPSARAALDGTLSLLANYDTPCLTSWSDDGSWSTPAELGTTALSLQDLVVDRSGRGLALGINSESSSLFVAKTDGEHLIEQPRTVRYAADLSPSGIGGLTWIEDNQSIYRLHVRRYDDAGFGEAHRIFEYDRFGGHVGYVAAAAADSGVVAASWVHSDDERAEDKIYLALSRPGADWEVHEVRTTPMFDDNVEKHSVVNSLRLAIASDGWVYLTWQEYHNTELSHERGEVWALSFYDGDFGAEKLANSTELSSVLVCDAGQTALVWVEEDEDGRKVAVRRVNQGEWGATAFSPAEMRPSHDLGAAIDPVGNIIMTWVEGYELCAARHSRDSWQQKCGFLPRASFTSPVATVDVNERGRGFLAWFGGATVHLATFD